MKTPNDTAQQILEATLDRAQREVVAFNWKDKPDGLVLYGAPGAVLDSFNLVTLVFILEEEIARAAKINVKITAEDVLNPDVNPFSGLEALRKFVLAKLAVNASHA